MSPEYFWVTTSKSCIIEQCVWTKRWVGYSSGTLTQESHSGLPALHFGTCWMVLENWFFFFIGKKCFYQQLQYEMYLVHPCKIFWDQDKKNVMQSISTSIVIKLIIRWYSCVTCSLVQLLCIHWILLPLNSLLIYAVFCRCQNEAPF